MASAEKPDRWTGGVSLWTSSSETKITHRGMNVHGRHSNSQWWSQSGDVGAGWSMSVDGSYRNPSTNDHAEDMPPLHPGLCWCGQDITTLTGGWVLLRKQTSANIYVLILKTARNQQVNLSIWQLIKIYSFEAFWKDSYLIFIFDYIQTCFVSLRPRDWNATQLLGFTFGEEYDGRCKCVYLLDCDDLCSITVSIIKMWIILFFTHKHCFVSPPCCFSMASEHGLSINSACAAPGATAGTRLPWRWSWSGVAVLRP